MIDCEPEQIDEVVVILRAHVPDRDVLAFGSRVTGEAGRFSDLDLALKGDGRIEWARLDALRDALSESDLPFMVDVLDWNAITNEFREIIERRYEVLLDRGLSLTP